MASVDPRRGGAGRARCRRRRRSSTAPRLSTAWIDALDASVVRGGTLATVEADAALLARFGVEELGTSCRTATAACASRRPTPRRCALHVVGRRWRLSGAVTIATFVRRRRRQRPARPAAAVTIGRGAGVSPAWAFDLARNVAFIRQGNPQLDNAERDGFPPQSASSIHVRLGPSRRPRAAGRRPLQQALVSGLAAGGSTARRTAPRRRLFPLRCGLGVRLHLRRPWRRRRVLDEVLRRVEARGGRTTVYYEPNPRRRLAALCPARAAAGAARCRWSARGWKASTPPPSPRMRRGMAGSRPRVLVRIRSAQSPTLETRASTAAWQLFEDDGYGTAHMSTRTHAMLWKGWVGNRASAARLGVRMNLDVYQLGPALRSQRRLAGRTATWSAAASRPRFVERERHAGRLLPAADADARRAVPRRRSAGPRACRAPSRRPWPPRTLIADARDQDPGGAVRRLPHRLASCRRSGATSTPPRAFSTARWPPSATPACRSGRSARWLRFLDGRRDTAVAARSWDAAPTAACPCMLSGRRCRRAGSRNPAVPTILGNAVLDAVTVDGSRRCSSTPAAAGAPGRAAPCRPARVQLVAQYRRA